VLAAARGDGHLTVIRAGGQRGAELLDEQDLTVRRRGGERENDAQARGRGAGQRVKEVSAQIEGVTADAPGNDLLGGLDAAGRVPGTATVLVVGSGLQTVAPLDFRKLGWNFDPRAVVKDLTTRRLLPDLRRKQVIFAGLGRVAGSQRELPRPARQRLGDLWCAIVAAAHGECIHDDELAVTAQPRATLPVPVVDVPTVTTMRTGGRTQVTIPDYLLFAADSAALQPSADDVLKSYLKDYAHRLRQGGTVDITGHTASVGPVAGRYALSDARARAVAARLRALGAPRTAIGLVRGVGSDHGVPDRDASGRLIEQAAARNRVVDLVLH
jgi:outer membrane protein OmpA-like peptidoglycan-associated protein